MPKQFLTTSTVEYLNLQSGNAAPYFYIEAIVSGVTSVIGDSYTSTNYLIDGGVIDREKPILPGDRSRIFSSDVTLKVDNSTQRFSPFVTGSQFYDNDYLESTFNYWAGFINVSATALLLQRGSFILSNLKLDSRQSVAYMLLRDKFKRPLDAVIGAQSEASGTAIPFTITGTVDGSTALQSLFISGAFLTAGDFSLQTAAISFNNLSFNEQTVAQAASLVAEASDGYIFTSKEGILTFKSNAPIFGTAPAANLTIRESDYAMNIFMEETKDDLLNEVTVSFLSGVSASITVGSGGISGRSIALSNDVIQSTADAVAIGTRILDRFSGQVTKLEIDSIWAPSLELGNIIAVHSTSLGFVGKNFEIYKMEEEPTFGTMRIYLVDADRYTGKWGFFSHATGDAGAGEHSAVFAGSGAGQSGSWKAGFAFFAQTSGAETTAGFDTDGNNNAVIESGAVGSGAGAASGTGIEVPFMFY